MKFAITAGHSNTDPGAVANGVKEADLAVWLRDTTVSKLRQMGHSIVSDGEPGQNQALTMALTLITQADKAIEIHFNAAASSSAGGVETISLHKDKVLAQKLSQAIADVLMTKVRGDAGFIDQNKSARGKLGYVNRGGLIIEVCFITNKTEMAFYNDRKWLVASAIARTLDDWSKR